MSFADGIHMKLQISQAISNEIKFIREVPLFNTVDDRGTPWVHINRYLICYGVSSKSLKKRRTTGNI